MSERVRIFSNGFEYEAWTERNCDRCPKAGACEIEEALSSACVLDGTIAPEVAERLGYREDLRATLGWPCKERTAGPTVPPEQLPLPAETIDVRIPR